MVINMTFGLKKKKYNPFQQGYVSHADKITYTPFYIQGILQLPKIQVTAQKKQQQIIINMKISTSYQQYVGVNLADKKHKSTGIPYLLTRTHSITP